MPKIKELFADEKQEIIALVKKTITVTTKLQNQLIVQNQQIINKYKNRLSNNFNPSGHPQCVKLAR